MRRLLRYALPLGLAVVLISSLLMTSAQGDIEPQIPDAEVPAGLPAGNVPLVIYPEGMQPTPVPTIPENLLTDNPDEEDKAMQLVNDLRERIGGLNCLVINETLRNVAYAHSKDMHDRNFFSNTNPDGQTAQQRAAAAGYTGQVGQSVTAGANDIRDTAEEAVASIRASRSNYLNLIQAGYQEMGFGWFSGTQNFQDYWSFMFGFEGGVNGVACDGTAAAITHIPTVQQPLNRNLTLPTFQWTRNTSSTTGRTPATHFDIEILDINGARVLQAPTSTVGPTYEADNICTTTTCSVTPGGSDYENGTGLVNGQTYQVWVRAYSETGGYVWSADGFNFTVDSSLTPDPTDDPTPDPNTPTPGGPVPVLLQPGGTSQVDNGSPVFTWQALPGSTGYEIYAANQATLYEPIIYTMLDAARFCIAATCQITDPAALGYVFGAGTYSVYMRAWTNGTPTSNWGGPYDFTITAAAPPLPTNLGLLNLTSTLASRPVYTWNLPGTPNNVTQFTLYVAPQNNLAAPVMFETVSREKACGSPSGTACALTSTGDWLTNTPHVMYINSFGPGGSSTGGTSGFAEATLNINAAVPAVPTFTVDVQQGLPLITLPADRNVSFYQIKYEVQGQVFASEWIANPCVNGPCVLNPGIDLLDGYTYAVSVQAYGPAGYNNNDANDWGGPVNINVSFGAPQNPTTLIATNGSTGSPTLSWQAGTGSIYYAVAFDYQGAVFDVNYYVAADIGCGNGGTCTVNDSLLLLPTGYTFGWTVYGLGTGGYSSGAVGPVITVNAVVPVKSDLLQPNALTFTAVPNPIFEWRHQQDVVWYQISVNTGKPETTPDTFEAVYSNWHYQKDLDCENDAVCTLAIPDLYLGNGGYSFTVRGYSLAGIGPWSDPQIFTIRLP